MVRVLRRRYADLIEVWQTARHRAVDMTWDEMRVDIDPPAPRRVGKKLQLRRALDSEAAAMRFARTDGALRLVKRTAAES